ncbi:MAG: diguanylate cyclase domain protein [Geminicoccaceae bacterium]|nr:diguanylate cyclase domain protein [Geminicoccaceae bacterium]
MTSWLIVFRVCRSDRVAELLFVMPNVIVIDDRVTNRNILARLAASVEEGVRVKAFAGPQAALDSVLITLPDLVITDYKMPGMDGADFVRAFRALPGARDVPVVVVTVYEDRTYCYQALEAGATDFLLSPVDHVEFRARARNLLTLRKQQKLLEQRTDELRRELVSSSEQHEAALRASELRLRRLIDTVPASISAVDSGGRLTLINSAHKQLYGIDPAGAIGRTLEQVCGEEHATKHLVLNAKVFETGETLPSFEQEVAGPGADQERILLTTKSPLFDDAGRVADVVTVSLDITELKRAEAQMRHQAGHDALTGLPNRALFRDYLDHALARARRADGIAAVLLLDLDRFKGINDAFGLACGDLLLRAAAERLHACLRETDAIARLGGDEFVILQTDVRNAEEARALARRLIDSFGQPFVLNGEEFHTSASIGITLFPADGQAADRLLKNSELAMYRAKSNGRNGSCFFAPQMNLVARRTGLLERELRQGFAADQFTVHYQPQRDLRSGEIVGIEALLRWRHPRRGMVRPSEFVGLAEDIGLIGPLTERVLEQACRQHRQWQRAGLPPLRLSVNLSPGQFREGAITLMIENTLAETGLDPSWLEIELTEGVMLDNSEVAMNSLRRLHQLGVSFSLDDFGTGYSSLAYVKRLPIQRLKIDQSFVHRLGQDGQDEAIVRAVIDLGHSLNLKVTAEGVETAEQLARLHQLGCDEAQGDLISPPLPAEDFHVLFQHRDLPAVASG